LEQQNKMKEEKNTHDHKELTALRKNIGDKDTKLVKRNHLMIKQAQEIKRLRGVQKREEAEIKQLKNTLKMDANKMNKLAEKQQEELNLREMKNAETLANYKQSTIVFKERIAEMEQHDLSNQNTISEEERMISRLNKQLDDQDLALKAGKRGLENKLAEIKRLHEKQQAEEKKYGKAIWKLQNEIKTDEEKIAQQNQIMQNMEKKNGKVVEALHGQEGKILHSRKEYERNIDASRKRIAQLEQMDLLNKKQISEEENMISMLRKDLDEKDMELKTSRNSLSEQVKEVRKLRQARTRLQSVSESHANEIARIKMIEAQERKEILILRDQAQVNNLLVEQDNDEVAQLLREHEHEKKIIQRLREKVKEQEQKMGALQEEKKSVVDLFKQYRYRTKY